MPFAASHLTNFFTAGTQMNLNIDQRNALVGQGLVTAGDFRDFEREELIVA